MCTSRPSSCDAGHGTHAITGASQAVCQLSYILSPQVVFSMKRHLVAEVGKSIGRHLKTAEPSLTSAPRPNLYPGFPLGRPKGNLAGFPGSCPPREGHSSLLVTLELELAVEENAPPLPRQHQENKVGLRRGLGEGFSSWPTSLLSLTEFTGYGSEFVEKDGAVERRRPFVRVLLCVLEEGPNIMEQGGGQRTDNSWEVVLSFHLGGPGD